MDDDHFDPWNEPPHPRIIPGWVVAAVAAALWVLVVWASRGAVR